MSHQQQLPLSWAAQAQIPCLCFAALPESSAAPHGLCGETHVRAEDQGYGSPLLWAGKSRKARSVRGPGAVHWPLSTQSGAFRRF